MSKIKLQSAEGEIFEVDLEVAKMSITIKTMLENLEADDDDDVIPLLIDATVLKKVIEYAEYHKNDRPPRLPSEYDDDDFVKCRDKLKIADTWDKKFIIVDEEMIQDLLVAANFLDMKGLLDLTGKAIALILKRCKTAENIRKKFGIKNDFSNEEWEKIEKDNAFHRKCEMVNQRKLEKFKTHSG